MKKLLSLLAIALSLSMGAAHAEDAAKTPQQNKMASCNKEAGDKKGDERKAFMKDCLSAKPAAAPDKKTAQQDKMKTCNEQAKDKKGDERKKFMSECLKSK
jgi:psiF repeat